MNLSLVSVEQLEALEKWSNTHTTCNCIVCRVIRGGMKVNLV